ncbi:hypothetical protein AHAS_Ahas18G0263700 [Arachis hypogaea]|uniref:Uncharacterized protein n=1 Tax=Arachis hypogaea TaxID=3818 RepID=A0A444XY08_ARAHY|nr:hypothetical protein Ahy_B08g089510 [Arachis hypogaea]
MGPIDDPHFAQPLKRSVSTSASVPVSTVVVRYSLLTVMATTKVAAVAQLIHALHHFEFSIFYFLLSPFHNSIFNLLRQRPEL